MCNASAGIAEVPIHREHYCPRERTAIKLVLADGDMVVCLLEYRGNHATFAREAVWREAWFVRLSEGKIVEGWPVVDESSFLRQLGYQLVPPRT